jgi:FkbM family methyltransferase
VTEVSENQPPLCACTAATVADLPAARVVAGTFRAKHPGSRFVILLVDGDPVGQDVVTPAEIGVADQELARLATCYTAAQARVVLRPRLLESLLSAGRPVLYLDPQVLVLDSVTEIVADGLRAADVLLVPRVLHALPEDGRRPAPHELRAAGVYDPGFLAVAPGAEPLLRSWADRARRDPDGSDTFLDGVPALVDHRVVRDEGIGLSVWNAGQRELSGRQGGPVLVGDSPLRTVNFSGFDPKRPWLLSARVTERPRVLLSEHPLLERLCADYRDRLREAASPEDAESATLRFGRLTGGAVLPNGLRAEFRGDWLAAERDEVEPPAPSTDEGAFLRWACAPVAGLPGSTRWSLAVWREDPVLRQRFPEPFGEHAAEFREWCEVEGVAAERLHPAGVPVPVRDRVPLVDQLGVSVLGGGPLAERVRAAAMASGVPVSTEPSYPVVVCCGEVEDLPRRRHVIALRETRSAAPGAADELWVPWPPSAADGADPTVPVRSLLLPVLDLEERGESERARARAAFGVDAGPVFTGFVDHASAACQNPTDILSAFAAAFTNRPDARLLLVVRGAARHPERAERLRLATSRDRRIQLVEDESRHRLAADAADWAVLLHEPACPATEMTELAVRGIPLITINAGAAAELFDQDTAVFVSCVDTKGGPDVKRAALTMRELASDVAAADKIGAAARDHLLATHSVPVAAGQLREKVEQAYRSWRVRHAGYRGIDGDADPVQLLLSARHALLRRPDVWGSYKIPMAPALRKAVLRVLNHYDRHLRAILGSIVDGVERSTTELMRRQDEVAATMAVQPEQSQPEPDPRVDRLISALDTATRRIDVLEARLSEQLGDRDDRLAAGVHAANQALRASDALRRVVVRQHQRLHDDQDEEQTPSSLVLCDAGMLRLPAADAMMLPVLSSNGVWEPDVADAIDSLVEPGGVFLDVGAYVGYHTLRVLSRLGTSGAVVAVEPSADAVRLLRQNVAVNVSDPVADGLFVVNAAAWDTQAELQARPALGGGVSVSPAPPDGAEDEAAATVRAVRLDREIEQMTSLNGMPLTVVKVDVPGRGHRALGGLVRLLRRDRPHVICSFAEAATREFGDDPMAVLREFGTWGYEVALLGQQRACPLEEIAETLADGTEKNLWLRPLTSRFDFVSRDG